MKTGVVFLVGAGPGDPGLITVQGRHRIETANVVVYDRLVNRTLLDYADSDAELIDVGKVPGRGAEHQAEINSLLVERAKRGQRVVRLKGGDPFVFGRGGEEAEALQRQGVAFEVVPGVTSAIAAPAYAGIPVTHRGLASAFTVVTGSEAPGKAVSAVAWDKLAKTGGTLVVLMGRENLAGIVDALVQHGRPPDTPIAVVQWATEPHQRTVVGTLSDIVGLVSNADLTAPVVAVIGETVELREALQWFDNRPLFGKRVLVTRTRPQAGALSLLLLDRGAQPVELPTIEIRPLEDYSKMDGALGRLDDYQWVVFTSANAVQAVFDRLYALGMDSRAFGTAKVAAIGPATATSLRDRGIAADFVPVTFVSAAIADGLGRTGLDGSRILLPRADIAPDALSRILSTDGAVVDDVTSYRTVTPKASAGRARQVLADGVDIVTFTSSSTVRSLANLLGGDLDRLSGTTIACIGPVTAATARELGLGVEVEARVHTVAGLVDALEEYFTKEGSDDG